MAGIIHPTTTANIGFGFGSTNFEFYEDRWWHGAFYNNFHGGIDYWGPLESPIWATANGYVLYVGYAVPYIGAAGGIGVVLQHGPNMKSIYGHMNSTTVVRNQQVVQGQKIGGMGQSGHANGVTHVHFEIRTITEQWGEDVENPYALMSGGALANTNLANATSDIPWIDPTAGTSVKMALATYKGDNKWLLPTYATQVLTVYFDRMVATTTMYSIQVISGGTYIVPLGTLDPETEVRVDYIV